VIFSNAHQYAWQNTNSWARLTGREWGCSLSLSRSHVSWNQYGLHGLEFTVLLSNCGLELLSSPSLRRLAAAALHDAVSSVRITGVGSLDCLILKGPKAPWKVEICVPILSTAYAEWICRGKPGSSLHWFLTSPPQGGVIIPLTGHDKPKFKCFTVCSEYRIRPAHAWAQEAKNCLVDYTHGPPWRDSLHPPPVGLRPTCVGALRSPAAPWSHADAMHGSFSPHQTLLHYSWKQYSWKCGRSLTFSNFLAPPTSSQVVKCRVGRHIKEFLIIL